MIRLTELQLDALGEGFNIALGRAAATFSELVREPVHISVPCIELLSTSAMRERISALYSASGKSDLCGIHQSFTAEGNLRTDTMLVFTKSDSLDIIRQMLGGEMSIADFTELEQDALAEIGNIMTNSCMSTFADLFNISMTGSLPRIMINDQFSLVPDGRGYDTVLLAQISLSLTSRDTRGLVLFLMDGPTIRSFVNNVDSVLGVLC